MNVKQFKELLENLKDDTKIVVLDKTDREVDINSADFNHTTQEFIIRLSK